MKNIEKESTKYYWNEETIETLRDEVSLMSDDGTLGFLIKWVKDNCDFEGVKELEELVDDLWNKVYV